MRITGSAATALIAGVAFLLMSCGAQPSPQKAVSAAEPDRPIAAGPTAATLLAADREASNWLLAGHGYGNNRAVSSTITTTNVGSSRRHGRRGWQTMASKKRH